MGRLLVLLLLLPLECLAIIGENQIIEKPRIECGEEGITFSIRTLHAFRGSIFIKGQHDSETCRMIFYNNEASEATFSVRVGDCGMIRLRQPSGISYKTVFVATFHPQLVTKVDRSYSVHCFYEQATKFVEHFMEIGPIPTDTIEQHQTLFPSCSYTVREGSLEGPIARTTAIGKTLVHRWECDNPRYGILVRNCVVTDGDLSSIKVLDERGCPVIGEIPSVGQLVYDTTLNFAYIAIEAFSFAGRSSQQFRCEIKVCSKVDDECAGLTPPSCPSIPRGFRPNSIVETDMVGVTKVLGTFQGSIISNRIGSPMMNQPLREILPPTMLVPDSIEPDPWLKEHNSIQDEEHLIAPMPVLKENSTKIEETAEPAEFDAPEPRIYLRDDPVEILVKSTTPASEVKHFEDTDQRQRRLADSVFDIESQSIEVHPLEEEDPVARPFVLRDEPLPDQPLTCLNRQAMAGLLVAFGLTTVVTVAFIVYLCSGILKTYRPSDGMEAFSARSTASCVSEDSELPTIFTRRLGQANYVLPVRMS